MICTSDIFVDKNHVALRLSLINVPTLNYLLRFEFFVSEDRQLWAAHLVLDYKPISRIFQEAGQAIRDGNLRLNRIDVSKPWFLAQRDLPPIMLPLQQVLPEPAVASREEVASSRLSLEEEIDKFHFEEREIQKTPLINILDTEEEVDRHSGVHHPTLVVARVDSTSEEEKG